MDGENSGKPLLIHGWFGGKTPLFSETPMYIYYKIGIHAPALGGPPQSTREHISHDQVLLEKLSRESIEAGGVEGLKTSHFFELENPEVYIQSGKTCKHCRYKMLS